MGQIFHSCNTAWYCDTKTEFTLNTPEELAGLAKLVNAGNSFMGKTIMLGQDITINSKKNSWEPIGTVIKTANEENHKTPFSGTFDGKGFKVSGIYINSAEYDRFQGLFGYTSSNTIIKNLGVTDSRIKGDIYANGLVGWNNGIIIDCYASASVEGVINVGGLVGGNSEKQAKRSFYNKETSGPNCGWEIEGKTTVEMKQKATYCDAGWDFDKIWRIDSKINNGYPYRFIKPTLLEKG
jgi:hypothetical protein